MSEQTRPDAFDRAVGLLVKACRLGPGLTPEQKAERTRLEQELAEFERRYPALAAKENALFERMDREIRRRVDGRAES